MLYGKRVKIPHRGWPRGYNLSGRGRLRPVMVVGEAACLTRRSSPYTKPRPIMVVGEGPKLPRGLRRKCLGSQIAQPVKAPETGSFTKERTVVGATR